MNEAVYVVLSLVGLVVGGGGIAAVVSTRKESKTPETIEAKKEKELSWPGRQVMVAYNQIPEEHKPELDLIYILEALDVKHVRAKVNGHFARNEWYYDGDIRYDWHNCECQYPQRCTYREYKNLHEDMLSIPRALAKQAEALEKKRHDLEVAGVQATLDEISIVRDRVRNEREIIEQTTKELTA